MGNYSEEASKAMGMLLNVFTAGGLSEGSSDHPAAEVGQRSYHTSTGTQTDDLKGSFLSTPEANAEAHSINESSHEDRRNQDSALHFPDHLTIVVEEPYNNEAELMQDSASRRGSMHHHGKSESREGTDDTAAVPLSHRRSSIEVSREGRHPRRISSSQGHQRHQAAAVAEQLERLNAENAQLRKQLMDAEMSLKIMNVRSAREAAKAARQSLSGSRRKSIDSSAALQNQFAFEEQRRQLMERKQSLKSFRADILDKIAGSGDDEPGTSHPKAQPRAVATTPPLMSPSLRASRRMSTGEIPAALAVGASKDEAELTDEPEAADCEDRAAVSAVKRMRSELRRATAEVKRLSNENHRLREEIERLEADL